MEPRVWSYHNAPETLVIWVLCLLHANRKEGPAYGKKRFMQRIPTRGNEKQTRGLTNELGTTS